MKLTFTPIRIALMALALIPCTNLSLQAQWQQLAGYKGEPVYWVRGTPTQLFSVTANGVLNSGNSGGQWNIIQDLYLQNTVERISTSGDTIVAYAFPESYLSIDNGQNWTTINNPPTGFQLSNMIVEDGVLYASTSGDFLYRSSNLGGLWTQITSNFGSGYINSITAEGATVIASTEDGIYRSNNSGSTFTNVALPGVGFNRAYISGNYVFAFSPLQGIYKSNDNGITWVSFIPVGGLPYAEILDFCLIGPNIYAAAFDDLIVSDTSGANWAPISYGQDVDFTFSVHKHGNALFAGTNRGVFTTANQGVSWTEVNEGLVPIATEALTVLNDTLFVGANVYGVSNYSGIGWEFSGLGLRNTFDLITRGSDLYTASDFGVYKSTDSGNNWTLLNSTPGNPFIAFCPRVDVSDSLIVAAALGNGILRSGDYGVSWSFQNTGMSTESISSVAISGSNIIAGTYANGLYTSTDGGFSWTQTGAAGEYISDMTTIGNTVIASSFAVTGNFISTDNGATWNPGPTDFLEDLSTQGNIILGSSGGYIMLSLDSGQTFQYQTLAPAGTTIVGSVASATDIYAGTNYDGVWKITLSEILSVSNPVRDLLSAHVYPNAFQNEATIVIDEELAAQSPDFVVTDVSGKVVQKMQINQPRTRFYGNKMNAGIYFYSVQTKTGKSKAGKFVIY